MKNEMPKIPNSNHKLLKKGTKLVLSAATFGVVAAGSFQGVNYVVDNYNKQNTTVQSTNVVKTSSSTTSTISEVAKNCMPSIVSITNVSVSDVQNYFSMYGNNSRSNPFTQQESTSVGSGVIINKKNGEIDILTNYHVIENAKTLTCTLADNTNVEATVKGVDEDRDLAVISIKTKDLSSDTLKQIAIATIGDSDKLQVGEISEPFIAINKSNNRQQVAMVKLVRRIEAHKADLAEDFQVLKDMYENKRKAEIIDEWVKEKQKKTYVHISEGWRNCEFKYNWRKQ